MTYDHSFGYQLDNYVGVAGVVHVVVEVAQSVFLDVVDAVHGCAVRGVELVRIVVLGSHKP